MMNVQQKCAKIWITFYVEKLSSEWANIVVSYMMIVQQKGA